MPFVIENPTEKDKGMLIDLNIFPYLGKNPKDEEEKQTMTPYNWIIDRENDIALIRGLVDKDFWDRKNFVLLWKKIPIKFEVSYRCENKNKAVYWGMIRDGIPHKLEEYRDCIIIKLKEAIKTYGINGIADSKYNQPKIIEISF